MALECIKGVFTVKASDVVVIHAHYRDLFKSIVAQAVSNATVDNECLSPEDVAIMSPDELTSWLFEHGVSGWATTHVDTITRDAFMYIMDSVPILQVDRLLTCFADAVRDKPGYLG